MDILKGSLESNESFEIGDKVSMFDEEGLKWIAEHIQKLKDEIIAKKDLGSRLDEMGKKDKMELETFRKETIAVLNSHLQEWANIANENPTMKEDERIVSNMVHIKNSIAELEKPVVSKFNFTESADKLDTTYGREIAILESILNGEEVEVLSAPIQASGLAKGHVLSSTNVYLRSAKEPELQISMPVKWFKKVE